MVPLRVGQAAVLVECAGIDEVRALHAEVLARGLAARDVVPAARTLLLDGVESPDAVIAEVASWRLAPVTAQEGRLVTVPVDYDGPDLSEVASSWEVTVEEVVERHTGAEYVVAFCGFAPGFAYCAGLPDEWAVPRRAEPRASVPAGSVGLAGAWTGVYPRSSPGGWQLLGRTSLELWNAAREEPALLSPGTRVRFVRA